MFCPKCGKQIADAAQFCPICGAVIGANRTSATPSQPGVQSDSRPVPLRNAAPARSYAPAQKKPPIKVIAIAAAVVVVVIIAIVGFSGNSNDGEQAPVPAEVVQVPAAPKTFEEWVDANDPNYANSPANDMLKLGSFIGAYDVQVEVSKNQINVFYYVDASSSDEGFIGSLLAKFANDIADGLTDGAALQGYADAAYYAEQRSGISPIYFHVELRYRDGTLINSYDFDSSGRIS